MAEALREWVPLVLHHAEPWLSEADIEAGQRWAQAVAKELGSSNFGVICVTRDNVSSPWILFEAGALAKSLEDSRVIPLLLDLEFSEITGPLAQFQAKKVEKGGLGEVIHSLNQVADDPVPEERTRELFEALWPKFEDQLASIPEEESAAKRPRPQHEILEELVSSVRGLDSRVQDWSESMPPSLRRRRRRWHPMMLEEVAHMVSERPGDPIGILVIASLFREQLPWLYELGMEAYRETTTGSPDEAAQKLRRFQRAAEILMHGPFEEMGMEMGVHPRELHFLLHELERVTLELPPAEEKPRRPAKPKREPPGRKS